MLLLRTLGLPTDRKSLDKDNMWESAAFQNHLGRGFLFFFLLLLSTFCLYLQFYSLA